MFHLAPGACLGQHRVRATGPTPQFDAAFDLVGDGRAHTLHQAGVAGTRVGGGIGAHARGGGIGQGGVVVDLGDAALDQGTELCVAQAGTAVDDQGDTESFVDGRQALQVQARLAGHAAMHRTDGHGEKIHAAALHVFGGFLRGGVDHLAGMLLGILALDSGHVAQFAFHRHRAAMGHVDHRAGANDVLLEGMGGGIHHDAGTAEVDAADGGFQAGAMVEVDGDRDARAPCRRHGGGHGQFEVVVLEMGLGQAQDDGGLLPFGGIDDGFQEVQADQVEAAHRVLVVVGVLQHVPHVDQRHGRASCLVMVANSTGSFSGSFCTLSMIV